MAQKPPSSRAYCSRSDVSGNGMFASEDIPAGALIFETRPLVTALDTKRLPDTCSNCFLWTADQSLGNQNRADVNLRACTGCSTVRYCSKQCQTESWKSQHKYECKLLRKFPPNGPLPNAARAVLQMMHSGSDWDKSPFKHMSMHMDDVTSRGGERYDAILTLSTGLHQYTETPLPIQFIQLCFALCFTNSLTIWTPTYDSLGLCVDPFVSCANHSCEPNATTVWDGPELSFRSLKPIATNEEIFIAYIDTSYPQGRRQHELDERYYFHCRCSKCARDEPEDGFLRAPSEEDDDAFQLLLRSSLVRIDGCTEGAELPGFTGQAVHDNGDTLGHGQDHYETLSLIQKAGFAAADAVKKAEKPLTLINTALKACLETRIWPEHRQPVPLLRQERFVLLLQPKTLGKALREGLRLYFDVWPVLYPQPFHPQRVAHRWTLARLCLWMASERESLDDELGRCGLDFGVVVWGLLMEIEDNVNKSHGKGTGFARTVREKVEEVRVDMTRASPGQTRYAQAKIEEQWSILRRLSRREGAAT